MTDAAPASIVAAAIESLLRLFLFGPPDDDQPAAVPAAPRSPRGGMSAYAVVEGRR